MQRKISSKIALARTEHVSSSIIQSWYTDSTCAMEHARNFLTMNYSLIRIGTNRKGIKFFDARRSSSFPQPWKNWFHATVAPSLPLLPLHPGLRCRFRGRRVWLSRSKMAQRGQRGPRQTVGAARWNRKRKPKERGRGGRREGKRKAREAAKPSVSRYKQSQFPASVRAGGKDFACATTKRQYSVRDRSIWKEREKERGSGRRKKPSARSATFVL